MLGFAWLTLRQAQEALRTGRLEEAHRLLVQSAAQGHRRTGELLVRLARAYAERGERQLKHDDAEAAWRDLLAAEQLQTGDKGGERLRQALTRLGLAEVRALLQAGEAGRADETLTRLRQRGVRSPELRVLEDAVKGWLQAQDLTGRGEFDQARDAADRVRRLLLGPLPALQAFRSDLERRRQDFAALLARLHEAAEAGRWAEVTEVAGQLLAIAPHHAEAQQARARAWKAVEPATIAMAPPGEVEQGAGTEPARDGLPVRYMLWIDGVGSYLVCLGTRLTFGQAALDVRVDVPLVADVSRLHATLTRDAEGYVLEAVRPIQVNGQTVTRALLQPGDRVTLGTSCQFLFRVPVPVSGTARLDLVSGHRLPLTVDGILLMADTLVLGNVAQVHVSVPDLQSPVVLFRNKDGLGVRHQGELYIDGQKSTGRALLGQRAVVSGDDIGFAIEPVGVRMGQG